MICIQETKCSLLTDAMKDSIWPANAHGWIESRAQGLSGGILLSWDTSLISKIDESSSKNWIHLRGNSIPESLTLNFVSIYAPQESTEKSQVWLEIQNIMSRHKDEPFCIIGDFNSIRNARECEACVYRKRDSTFLNAFIKDNLLWDLPLIDFSFTWYGPLNKKSRLDRALLNSHWPGGNSWHLVGECRKSSDHIPLILRRKVIDWGPIPFKAYNFWLENKEFKAWLSDKLSEAQHITNSDQRSFQSWRQARYWIKKWSHEHKLDTTTHILKLEAKLIQADKSNCPSNEKIALTEELTKAYKVRDSIIVQKSRLNWDLKGEMNTKFFHQFVKYRTRKKSIHGIVENNVWISDPENIKNHFLQYFTNMFTPSRRVLRVKLEELHPNKLNSQDAADLSREFTISEVELALKNLDSSKAPGPDGLNGAFIKESWFYLKNDFMNMLKDFHRSGSLPKGLNSSFITLIPKTESPKSAGDYRPISLINFTMKILLKTLANRLNKYLSYLVSDHQSAFIKSRSISDSILVVNEVAHSILSKESKGVILKIDFAKAFDSINWEFLESTLVSMNFNDKWITWIKSISRSAHPSILINGSPTKEFSMNQGLRQGDPLSPLLFNLVGETLHLFLSKANTLGIFKGIFLRSGMQMTHMQFADDTILFIDNDLRSIKAIKILLKLFELISGLKINYQKSFLYGSAADEHNIPLWASILSCNVGSWPLQYLGASIGKSPRLSGFWDPLVNKVHNTLKKWRNVGTSIAGRLIVLKSVLDSIPIYWLGLYKIPSGVIDRLDKIRRDFIWNGLNSNSSKMHLIKWSTVCSSLGQGGLGISSIKYRNVSLLAKWWWKYRVESDKLWHKILSSKYGDWEALSISPSTSPIMSSILSVLNNQSLKICKKEDFVWKPGNGRKIKFWFDTWTGNSALKSRFPRLFELSRDKDISLYDMNIKGKSFQFVSTLFWRRTLREWEREEAIILQTLIFNFIPTNKPDIALWTINQGQYKASEGYKILSADNHVGNNMLWIWKCKIPPSVKIFLWKISLKILPTKIFLISRSMNLDPVCHWCGLHQEDLSHLFWNCSLATTAWERLSLWLNIGPINLASNDFDLHSLFSNRLGKEYSKYWNIFVAATLWLIWKARNECTFQNVRISISKFDLLLKITTHKWLRCKEGGSMSFNGLENIWSHNPLGYIKIQSLNSRDSLMGILMSKYDLVGFCDGSWSKDMQGIQKSGIGGIVFKQNKPVFIFSGPTTARSPLESEFQACLFLIGELRASNRSDSNIAICTDCFWLQEEFSIHKANDPSLKNFYVIYCDRELNSEADFLAKNGTNLRSIRKDWI